MSVWHFHAERRPGFTIALHSDVLFGAIVFPTCLEANHNLAQYDNDPPLEYRLKFSQLQMPATSEFANWVSGGRKATNRDTTNTRLCPQCELQGLSFRHYLEGFECKGYR